MFLRNDGTFHSFGFSLTNDDLSFTFDGVEFRVNSSMNQFYHSNYFSHYPLYLSNNATISDICINSTRSDAYQIVNSTNYILVTRPMNWNDAELFCEREFGTTLGVLIDQDEIIEATFLRDTLGDNLMASRLWIGLNAQTSNGIWRWYGNISCDYLSLEDCAEDSYSAEYAEFESDAGKCVFLIPGINDLNSSFLNTDCSIVFNPFLCDRTNEYSSYVYNKLNCSYYYPEEVNVSNKILFTNIKFTESISISFDLRLNHGCMFRDMCSIFHIGAYESTLFELYIKRENQQLLYEIWNKKENSHEISFQNGEHTVQHLDYDLDLLDGDYHKIDLFFKVNRQMFNFDNITYFMEWGNYDYMIIPQTYIGMNASTSSQLNNGSIRNLCILTENTENAYTNRLSVWRRNSSCDTESISAGFEILEKISFESITTVDGYELGWIKMMSCTEGKYSDFKFYNEYDVNSISDILSHVMSVKISPPGTAMTNDKYENFVVETVPCSEPVFSINNKKELTTSLYHFNITVRDTIDNDRNWMGTDNAMKRLSNSSECYRYLNADQYSRDFPVIYASCDGGINIDVLSGRCQWNHGVEDDVLYGQNIEIYFGFATNKRTICNYDIDSINVATSPYYHLVQYELNAFDAEMFCEQNFGTTLALIIYDVHVERTLDLRVFADVQYYEDLWIGLFKPTGYKTSDRDLWQSYTYDITNYTCSGWYGCWEGWYHKLDGTSYVGYTEYSKTMSVDDSYCAALNGMYFSSNDCVDVDKQFLCDRNIKLEIAVGDFICNVFVRKMDISRGAIANNDIQIGAKNSILFEIKIDRNFVCPDERCNILRIGNSSYANYPAIFIKGDDLEIYIYDLDPQQSQPDVIINGRELLCDGEFHLVNISFSYYHRIYSIDETKYFMEYSVYHFEKYTSSAYINPLYISDPWSSAVIGTINNLCIYIDATFIKSIQWEVLTTGDDTFGSVGYWNNSIVFVNGTIIKYKHLFLTDFLKGKSDAIDNSVDYNKKTLTDEDAHFLQTTTISQQYTVQLEETMYIFQKGSIYAYNLEELAFNYKDALSPDDPDYMNFINYADTCVTSNDIHLFLINEGIVKYDIGNREFIKTSIGSSEFPLWAVACSVNIYNDKLYTFGGEYWDDWSVNYTTIVVTASVYEYDILLDYIQLLPDVNLRNNISFASAITDSSNLMYICGGEEYIYGDPWNDDNFDDNYYEIRPVFNAETRQFDTFHAYADIDILIDMEHNVLMRDALTNVLLRWNYGTIFYLVSVPTATTIRFIVSDFMWRSRVTILYEISSYTQYKGLYTFSVTYLNDAEFVQYIMMIDDYRSNCYLCDEYQWSADCLDVCHFAVDDHIIDPIDVNITLISPEIIISGSSDFVINFNKCNIDYKLQSLDDNYVTIEGIPQDIVLCGSNPSGSSVGYITHINNTAAEIDHFVVITIGDVVSCSICDISNGCKTCANGVEAVITPEMEVDGSFVIYMTPITNDLIINKQRFVLIVDKTRTEISKKGKSALSTEAIIGIAVAVLFTFILIVGSVLHLLRRNKQIKEQKLRARAENTAYIQNVMVIFIGINSFENKATNLSTNIGCRDLLGINIDYKKIEKLCKAYNYELYPSIRKLNWKQNEVTSLLGECAIKAGNSDSDYDGILAIFSCNGYKKYIVTSDYHLMDKTALHRIFSLNFPTLRSIPRIFIYDTVDNMNWMHDDNAMIDFEQSKRHFRIQNAQFINKKVREWARDQHNPDHKLVIIDSIHQDIKSKSNKLDGSRIIYEFVKKMMDGEQFIGDMMEDIQRQNRQNEKLQITKVFNTKTEYLKFKRNKSKITKTQNKISVHVDDDTQKNDDYGKHIDIIEMEHVLDAIDDNNIEYSDNGGHTE